MRPTVEQLETDRDTLRARLKEIEAELLRRDSLMWARTDRAYLGRDYTYTYPVWSHSLPRRNSEVRALIDAFESAPDNTHNHQDVRTSCGEWTYKRDPRVIRKPEKPEAG